MVHNHHHHRHRDEPAKPPDYVLLPQVSGNGYYPYSPTNRQYGTQKTVDALVAVAKAWFAENSGREIGVGDMCFRHGGPMSPHHSHRDGKEVDIRPLRTDRKSAPVNIHAHEYDRAATAKLVALLLANPNVHVILFNDSSILGVKHWQGHDNHLHVKMKE